MRKATGATKTIVERYLDYTYYTQTIAAVLSEVSPENQGATLIVVSRTGPDAMEHLSLAFPTATIRPISTYPVSFPDRRHS